MNGYKLVRVVDNRYLSVYSVMAVSYQIGHKTVRPADCGPLALFDTVASAKNFIRICRANYIYTLLELLYAEYTPSKDRSLWYPNDHLLNDEIKSKNISTKTTFDDVPDGTIFADDITPLQVVPLQFDITETTYQ